ncbi:hypothetical protein MTP99_015587 [Tenebrio molitor]|nr:hypothetical protein MTP99_015587 [Tenebrio molitor]
MCDGRRWCIEDGGVLSVQLVVLRWAGMRSRARLRASAARMAPIGRSRTCSDWPGLRGRKACAVQPSEYEKCAVQWPGPSLEAMSSKFIIDSMLPKYHQQFHHQQLFQSPAATASLDAGLATCSSSSPSGSSPQHSSSSASSTSPAARMYPYVSAAAAHHHHQQQAAAAVAFGAASGSMVPSFSSTASTAALAAAVDAAADKSCRYTAGLAANVAPADSMVNYTLGHHHQNGAAVSAASSVSAASASMAVAAQFYHQAASAVVDPLNSCSQPAAPGGQPIPDIPRYPWMSITDWMSPFDRVVCEDDINSIVLSLAIVPRLSYGLTIGY